MPEFLSVSDAARELSEEVGVDILPRDISRLFYDRQLRDDLCPIIGGRRVIPRGYLQVILMALRRHNLIRPNGGFTPCM